MDTTTGAVSSAAPSPRKPGVLINRNFALLWLGQTISYLGDFTFNTTLVLWVGLVLGAHQQWAPLAVSGLLIAEAVPILLIGPLAGVFVDRWDKRRTMIVSSVVQALLVGALLPLVGIVAVPFAPTDTLPLEWRLGAVYGVVFLVNACARFFGPAFIALIGDIVPEASQPRAMGLNQTSSSLAVLLGPTLAAPLFLALGPTVAILVDALSFVAGFLLLLLIRAPHIRVGDAPSGNTGVWREFRAGVRFLMGNRTLVIMLLSVGVAMLGIGALNALELFFYTQQLQGPVPLYGLMNAALALGSILGAVLAGLLTERLGLARSMWLSLLGLGMSIVVWSRLTDYRIAFGVLFFSGITQAWLNVAAGPLMLRVTPSALVGRVTALVMPILALASLLSVALAGYLASTALAGLDARVLGVHLGALDAIFGASGVLCVAGGVFAALNLREPPRADAEPGALEPDSIPAHVVTAR